MNLRLICAFSLATTLHLAACDKVEETLQEATNESQGTDPATGSQPAGVAPPTPKLATLAVQVDETKPNGKAWDVRKGLPDIAVCFKEGGEETCLNGERSLLEPYCQDALSCTMTGLSLPTGSFEILVIDADALADDTIGQGVCAVGKTCKLGAATVTISGDGDSIVAATTAQAPQQAAARMANPERIETATSAGSSGARIPAAFRGTYTHSAFADHDDASWRDVHIASSAIAGRLWHDGGLVSVTVLGNIRGVDKGDVFKWTSPTDDCKGTLEQNGRTKLILAMSCTIDGESQAITVALSRREAIPKPSARAGGHIDPFDRDITGADPIPSALRGTWSHGIYMKHDNNSWREVVISSSSVTGRLWWGGGLVPKSTLGSVEGKTVDGQFVWHADNGCNGTLERLTGQETILVLNCPGSAREYDSNDGTIVVPLIRGPEAEKAAAQARLEAEAEAVEDDEADDYGDDEEDSPRCRKCKRQCEEKLERRADREMDRKIDRGEVGFIGALAGGFKTGALIVIECEERCERQCQK